MLLFDRIAGLERERASFAIATVVARRSPVSSHLGDRALIFGDGHMEGFVGGSCSRDIVRRYALDAIGNRRPVLLRIRPEERSAAEAADDTANASSERVTIPMSCSSEGAVDVYIEPRVPLRPLVVVGFTPVAQALARIAASLDYDVVRVVADSELRDLVSIADSTEPPQPPGRNVRVVELRALGEFLAALDERAQRDLVAIVASQGHYDELALEMLLERPSAFTGLAASRRRAATVVGVLAQQGLPAERLAAIANPVGLDIGARNPGEVAVSILAQIIAQEQSASAAASAPASGCAPAAAAGHAGHAGHAGGAAAATEIDPVCGMDVETAHALYRLAYSEGSYFFCSAHCRASFTADPERFLLPLGNT